MCSNGTNSCISTDLEPSGRYLASAVVYGLVLAVGLPLNTLSLWILLRTHGVRSPCAVLMVNLAVSDLLLALSLPLRVYFYATLRWPFGAATCTVALMVFRVNIRTSCIFITLISVDRMIALACPLRSRSLRTSGCALKSCAVVWILITILCIPEIIRLYGALEGCPNIPCFEIQALSKSSRVVSLSQAIFLLVLLLVNIVSTVVVVIVLRKRPSAGAAKREQLRRDYTSARVPGECQLLSGSAHLLLLSGLVLAGQAYKTDGCRHLFPQQVDPNVLTSREQLKDEQ